MNMYRAFMELDKLHESVVTEESFDTRQELINKIKQTGRYYNFDKYSDAQLYRILDKIQAKVNATDLEDSYEFGYDYSLAYEEEEANEPKRETCPTCDSDLTDGGFCPNCDDGRDDMLHESVDILEIGNYITDHCVFPSSKAKYDCILDIKSKHRSIGDIVSRDELNDTVEKFGGRLLECKKALTESWETEFLTIEGFDYYIEDTFEDAGFTGYEVVYSKDGTAIVKVEVWDESTPVTVIDNLYAPNLMQSMYDDFNQFVMDLDYKCTKYLLEDALEEGMLDNLEEVPTASGYTPMTSNNVPAVAPPAPPAQPTPSTSKSASSSGKYIVTIVYDGKAHKLRARADDGVHGMANVAFPNNLRIPGEQYEVDNLIWNGKNYRVSGNIKAI